MDALNKLIARAEAAEKKAAERLAVLQQMAWRYSLLQGGLVCNLCTRLKDEEHTPGCPLAAALRDAP